MGTLNKTIEFRGKSADERNEWIYGFLFSYTTFEDGKEVQHYAIGECLAHTRILPETVGQYTGIKDKTGKKIFEGDIIIGKGKNDWNEKIEKKLIVEPYNQMKSSFRDWFYFEEPEFEIIGNIHDNYEISKTIIKDTGIFIH